MVTDARAQTDLIARLHLEALSKPGHLNSDRKQSQGTAQIEPAFPHTSTHDSLQLRDRLAFIRSVALRAQGLTMKIEMAEAGSNRKHEPDSSLSPAEVTA
jgi:hypothetical protein